MDQIGFTIRDVSDEYSTVTFQYDPFTGLETITDVENAVEALAIAVGALTLGTIVRAWYRHEVGAFSDERPASPYAHREVGLRFFYHDGLGNKGNLTIPAPDLANIAVTPGTDLADLTDSEVAALVALIEANVEMVDGEGVTVDRAVVVGRNS